MTDEAGREGVEARGRFGLFVDIGAMGQAAITGGYAWAVSVAPSAWARGTTIGPKLAAIVAIASLVAGVGLERLSPPQEGSARVRPMILWTFVLGCALTWLVTPDTLVPPRMNAARGVASVLGWALFAHACAAPAVARAPEARTEPGLVGRAPVSKQSAAAIVVAALGSLALQGIGWNVIVPERAVLVRVVTLACGVALVSASAAVASEHHRIRRGGRAARLPTLWLVVLVVLVTGGVAWAWLR